MSDELLDEKLQADADAERERVCPYCRGLGYQFIDCGRLTWRCPDCEGTGRQQEKNGAT